MSRTIPVTGDVSAEAATAVIDVLLLAIIRASPEDEKNRDDYRRLNEAKSALFGLRSPKGPSPHDDLPELIYMAEAYIRERGKPNIGEGYQLEWPDADERDLTPPTVLAREAISARQTRDRSYKPHSDDKADNLQEKFNRNKNAWLQMAQGRADLAESVFTLKLRELAELFEPLGVQIKMPANALRDPKSPN